MWTDFSLVAIQVNLLFLYISQEVWIEEVLSLLAFIDKYWNSNIHRVAREGTMNGELNEK